MKNAQEQGFSLLEVLLAVVVLAVGIMGAVSLQTTSLRATSDASRIERAMTVARTEMDYQRGLTVRTLGTNNCGSTTDSLIPCSVTVVPCSVSSAGALSCAAGASSPVADRVAVTVTWRTGKTQQLASLVNRP